MTVKLPRYVSAYKDRHGKMRLRYRRTGIKTHYFSHPYPSTGFDAEYQFFQNILPGGNTERKTIPGSVDELAKLFMASTTFKGNETTKAKKRAIIQRFLNHQSTAGTKRWGLRPVAGCPYIKLDNYISDLAVKQPDGRGGPEAADRARKILKMMFQFAIKLQMRSDNPMEFVESTAVRTDGFHTWTETEISQYQAKHAVGTMARLALELMLWTGRRPTDASRLGRQHIDGEYLTGRASKGGKKWVLPIMPDLRQAIDAVNHPPEQLTFILNTHNVPFTSKGFGNRFAKWCDQAGLPTKCRAHGLRKAFLTRMAEASGTQQQLKAAGQHSNDREVATYVATANQKRLADQGMKLLQEYVIWLTEEDVSQNEQGKL